MYGHETHNALACIIQSAMKVCGLEDLCLCSYMGVETAGFVFEFEDEVYKY